MKNLFNPTTWLVGAAMVAVLALGHTTLVKRAENRGYDRGFAVGDAKYQAAMTSFHESMKKVLAQALQDNADLQASADERTKELQNEKAALDARVADLAERLRKRPSRPVASSSGNVPGGSGVASAAGICKPGLPGEDGAVPPGATGADLYRDDAEWLAREAGNADELRAAYWDLRARYEDVAATLKAVNERSAE